MSSPKPRIDLPPEAEPARDFIEAIIDRDLGNDSTINESIEYRYDANDRLFAELSDTADDTTTIYQYDHTQQTDKAVYTTLLDEATINSLADGGDDSSQQRVSAQHFGYNLQGRMSSVINDGYTDGTLSSRQRTGYTYDFKSYRVKLINESEGFDANGNPTGVWTETSSIEFLADHHNHTGYTQTIRETKTRADDSTQTIDYTFGHDEIAQRVHGTDESGQPIDETHVFGHDGHGSVRVLYDLAGTFEQIAQAFTFAAYGELLAVHGADAVAVPSTARLTSLGYSGEHFDARAQQQYLRARWYDPANGRFNRLDPFAGNMQDPQSLHKYAYVHGDPVQGVDPTGMFNVVSTLGSIGNALALGMARLSSAATSARLLNAPATLVANAYTL